MAKVKRTDLFVAGALTSTRSDEEVRVKLETDSNDNLFVTLRTYVDSDDYQGYTKRGFSIPVSALADLIDLLGNIDEAVKEMQ